MPSPLPRQVRWNRFAQYCSIDFGLPQVANGSAPALIFSWPAQRSLTLRPTDSPSRLTRPSTPEAPTALLSPPPLRLLPGGAIQFPGGPFIPLWTSAFHGAPQPPDLPPLRLMDMGFAVLCPLARHRRPPIRFLFIGSRLCSTLLSGPASRRVLFHPCASTNPSSPSDWVEDLPGRPGEFHSEPPTDPDVNLSIHPARATQRRLPPSIKTRSSSGFPLTPPRCEWPAPFAPRALPRFIALTKQCAPGRCIGTFGLVGSPLVPFPFASPTRFSSSVRKPR